MSNLPITLIYRNKFITESLKASSEIKLSILEKCSAEISRAIDILLDAMRDGGKVMLCGNGGSAADAQHLAAEFIIRLSPRIKRKGLPAIALTTDTSILTAGANDFGYNNIFARSVEALGRKGDVLDRHIHKRRIGEHQPGFSESARYGDYNDRIPRQGRRPVEGSCRSRHYHAVERYAANSRRTYHDRTYHFSGSGRRAVRINQDILSNKNES